MGCAVGACLGCVVMSVTGTPQRVCREGPVFAADELAWDGRLGMRAKRRVVTVERATGAARSARRRCAGSGRRSSSRRRGPASRTAPRAATARPRGSAAAPARRTSTSRVDLGRGLVLPNPILVASGTFGYGIEYGDVVEVDRLGAICCKGTTLKPRIGNPTPRVTETPGGMLNSIGLQNPGVDAVIEKYAATWAGWKVPVIVNVAGESVGDYVEVDAAARGRARASPASS